MILVTEEVITASLKSISATTKVILVSKKLMSANKNNLGHHKNYIYHWRSDHSHFKGCLTYYKRDLGHWRRDHRCFKSDLSHKKTALGHWGRKSSQPLQKLMTHSVLLLELKYLLSIQAILLGLVPSTLTYQWVSQYWVETMIKRENEWKTFMTICYMYIYFFRSTIRPESFRVFLFSVSGK